MGEASQRTEGGIFQGKLCDSRCTLGVYSPLRSGGTGVGTEGAPPPSSVLALFLRLALSTAAFSEATPGSVLPLSRAGMMYSSMNVPSVIWRRRRRPRRRREGAGQCTRTVYKLPMSKNPLPHQLRHVDPRAWPYVCAECLLHGHASESQDAREHPASNIPGSAPSPGTCSALQPPQVQCAGPPHASDTCIDCTNNRLAFSHEGNRLKETDPMRWMCRRRGGRGDVSNALDSQDGVSNGDNVLGLAHAPHVAPPPVPRVQAQGGPPLHLSRDDHGHPATVIRPHSVSHTAYNKNPDNNTSRIRVHRSHTQTWCAPTRMVRVCETTLLCQAWCKGDCLCITQCLLKMQKGSGNEAGSRRQYLACMNRALKSSRLGLCTRCKG